MVSGAHVCARAIDHPTGLCGRTGMSVEVCVLASGSAGNCTVVRTPAGTLLVDAGIGPRTAARRLAGTGAAVGEVCGIFLPPPRPPPLDHDPFKKSWLSSILSRGINVFCHESRVDDLVRVALGPRPSPET